MSVTVVPLLLLVHQWSQRRLTERWKKAKEVDADLTTSIQRSIASIWLDAGVRPRGGRVPPASTAQSAEASEACSESTGKWSTAWPSPPCWGWAPL